MGSHRDCQFCGGTGVKLARQQTEKERILDWLLRQPAVKAQAFFWNYSSRTERRKAMMREMKKELDNAN